MAEQAKGPSHTAVLDGIQYLRAAGCMIVVLFHSQFYFGEGRWVSVSAGGLSTLSFFVISAFVLAHSTRHFRQAGDWPGIGDFMVKRLLKLVPLYWLAIVLATLGYLLRKVDMNTSLQEFYWLLHPGLTEYLKDFLFIPHRSYGGEIYPLVIPAWTLNYEMLYYGVFSLALLTGRFRIALALGLLCCLGTLSFLARETTFLAEAYRWQVFFEFALGLVLYQLWTRFPPSAHARRTALVCFGAGLLSTFLGTWGHSRLGVAAGAAFLLWGGAHLPTGQHWLLRQAKHIGDASYSIYLFHTVVAFPIAFWCLDHFVDLRTRLEIGELGREAVVAGMGFVLVASVTSGMAIHRRVETPLVRWLLQWQAGHARSRTSGVSTRVVRDQSRIPA